jgi:GTP-binding protein
MEQLINDEFPFCLVLTKADKLKEKSVVQAYQDYENKLIERWGDAPTMLVSSAESQLGKDQILNLITTLFGKLINKLNLSYFYEEINFKNQKTPNISTEGFI